MGTFTEAVDFSDLGGGALQPADFADFELLLAAAPARKGSYNGGSEDEDVIESESLFRGTDLEASGQFILIV